VITLRENIRLSSRYPSLGRCEITTCEGVSRSDNCLYEFDSLLL
jgi:hypothetical protein